MKAYGGTGGVASLILDLAKSGGEWWASRYGHCPRAEGDELLTGLVAVRASEPV